MVKFRSDMEHFDVAGTRIANRTRFILRAVFATLTISSIYLVFMIYQMANRTVNWMSNNVNEMAAPMNSGPMSGFCPR